MSFTLKIAISLSVGEIIGNLGRLTTYLVQCLLERMVVDLSTHSNGSTKNMVPKGTLSIHKVTL